MNDHLNIVIPIIVYILISFASPSEKNNIKILWFEPPQEIFKILWMVLYGCLGYVAYSAKKKKEDKIFTFTYVMIALTYMWGIIFHYNIKYSIYLGFFNMLFAYYLYNKIFLSPLTENQNVVELTILSGYIIWFGYILSILIMSKGEKYPGKISSVNLFAKDI